MPSPARARSRPPLRRSPSRTVRRGSAPRGSGAPSAMARTGRWLFVCMAVIAGLNVAAILIIGGIAGLAGSRGGLGSLVLGLYVLGPAYGAALWYFLGRYLREMGAVTESLDRMAGDMVRAAQGKARLRRPYPTDRLVGAGSILRILMLVSMAFAAVMCLVLMLFARTGLTENVILCSVVGLNCVLPWLYGAYAQHSSQAIAQVSRRMFSALTRVERERG